MAVIGGYDRQQTGGDHAAMQRAATEHRAIGISTWDWPTMPSSAWAAVRGYDVGEC